MMIAQGKVVVVFFLGNKYLKVTWQMDESVTNNLIVDAIPKNLVLQLKNVIDLVELVDLKKTINLQMRLKETTVMKILDANVTTKNVKIESVLMLEEFA